MANDIWGDEINKEYHALESQVRLVILLRVESRDLEQLTRLTCHDLWFYVPYLLKNTKLSGYDWFRLYTDVLPMLIDIYNLRVRNFNNRYRMGFVCDTHLQIIQDYYKIIALSHESYFPSPDQFEIIYNQW